MKNILISGGTAGIGKAIVEYFDKTNEYNVYFTARNETKAKLLADSLSNTKYVLMDFSKFKSVVESVKHFGEQVPHLDVLINNAGTWQMDFKETSDGIEMNFAVNHLAPMLLTLELLPLLKKAPNARIINTSSGAHRRNILDFDDLEFRKKPYDGIATYSQSKLCNILFSLELSRHLEGTQVTVNTVHPGYVQSNLFDQMQPRNWEKVPSSDHGARSAIYVATANELVGKSCGYYYLESEELRISEVAKDTDIAHKLWTLSMPYLEKHITTLLT